MGTLTPIVSQISTIFQGSRLAMGDFGKSVHFEMSLEAHVIKIPSRKHFHRSSAYLVIV